MRNFLILLVMLMSLQIASGQLSKSDSLRITQLVSKHAGSIGLSKEDQANYIISSSFVTKEGLRLVYLNQSYLSIPVFNQLHVLAFKEDKLVSVAGGRIAIPAEQGIRRNAVNAIPVQDALRAALSEIKVELPMQKAEMPEPFRNIRGQLEFGRLGVSNMPVTAILVWLPEEEKGIRLAWQVYAAPAGTADGWVINIDAENGQFISKDNLTVYENPDHSHEVSGDVKKNAGKFDENYVSRSNNPERRFEVNNPPVVSNATYRVVKYPAESPQHPGGTPTLHTNPWTMAGGNATTLQWHNDGTAYHDSTRGNNVWAAEDRNNTNNITDRAAVSQTPQPNLTFNYVPDFTQSPESTTPPNQQFSITNLFYWSNIMHDISYLYGFDEAAGNFQKDNLGRGGLDNDYLLADAQDGFTVNNANFQPTPDGVNPRMQMFLFNFSAIPRDSDLDNGVIAHEYGHGISTRLTGGPAIVSCLRNDEQPGEGWSDFYALMLTTNWATATVNDGLLPRSSGTFLLNQPVNGAGFRSYPYSTNMAVNPLVYYNEFTVGGPHYAGTIWCTALWEMTWEMIKLTGINRNLFNAAGVGGNSAAMKLVTEAMKLQPCSPGFIDARNAILKADTIFFNGLYSCAIWKAFAKRGMGRYAKQGSAFNVVDQVSDFTFANDSFTLTGSSPTVGEGQNIVYTNVLKADDCKPVSGHFIIDTLPLSVSYVSGGVYNALTHTVRFGPISLLSGQSQSFPFTVKVNTNTFFHPVTRLNETVPNTVFSNEWTVSPANSWTISSGTSASAPYSFFTDDPGVLSEKIITSEAHTLDPVTVSNYTVLSFIHSFDTESGSDGGVVEISSDGGLTWTDLGSKMIAGKYTGILGAGSELAGRSSFTGRSGNTRTVINLTHFAGQTIKVRFRFASNNSISGVGWFVDDIMIYTQPAVSVKAALYDGNSRLINTADTSTKINAGCNQPVSILLQPFSVTTCPGNTVRFRIQATGSPLLYQWQINTGGGFSNIAEGGNYSGTNSPQLTLAGVAASMNGYAYRCVIANDCSVPVVSAVVYLFAGATAPGASPVANITLQPVNVITCESLSCSFSVASMGSTLTYIWQADTGSGFQNIPETGHFSGTQSATLLINNVSENMNGFRFRCLVSNSCAAVVLSKTASLTVRAQLPEPGPPQSFFGCGTGPFTFSLTFPLANATSYSWQKLSNTGYVDLTNTPPYSGVNTKTLVFTNATTSSQGTYRCIYTDSCNRSILFPNRESFVSFTEAPVLNPLPDQVLCNGQSFNEIIFSTSTIAFISWTNNTPSIGLASSGTGSLPSFTAVNNSSLPVTAIISVTASNRCGLFTRQFSITVKPGVLTINSPGDLVICAGSLLNAVDFGIPASAGATISWTNNAPSIGLAASGTGNLPSFTAVNTTAAPVTATIIVNATNGCGGAGRVFTIKVNPRVVLNPVPNKIVCAGSPVSAVDFGIPASAGATISWTNNTPSIGLASSGTGNLPSFTAVNNTAAPVTATIIVNAINSCSGAGKLFTITVNPKIGLNTIASRVVCAGRPVSIIDFGIPASTGATVTWTNSNPAIGLAASGTGNIPAFTAVNNTAIPVTAFISVNAANSCGGSGTGFLITVNPKVTLNSQPAKVVCAGTTLSAIDFGIPASTGATITWTNSNPAIGLAASGTGNIPAFTAVNNTTAPVTATITVNAVNGCNTASSSFTITVNPKVVMNAMVNKVVCAGTPVAATIFSAPASGGTVVYNWTNNRPGIGLPSSGTGPLPSFVAINGTCDPVTATITVTPVFTAGGVSCTGTGKTFTITVTPSAAKNVLVAESPAGKSNGVDTNDKVKNPEELFTVQVYPNPSMSNFGIRVNSHSEQTAELRVFDMNGKMIRQIKAAPGIMIYTGEELAAGTYIAEIIQGHRRKQVKLVKIN